MPSNQDNIREAIKANHPWISEENLENLVKAKSKQYEMDNPAQTKEWYQQFVRESWNQQNVLDSMAYNATKMWEDISNWAGNLISDDTAKYWSWLEKWADLITETFWDWVWWTVRAVWSAPKFVWDVWWLVFWDSEWWYWKTKDRANELKKQWLSWAAAWITAIEEWANSDDITWEWNNVFAQTIDQVINNPLLFRWVSSLLKAWGKVVKTAGKVEKWLAKVEKWIAKVWSVADDAAKAWGKQWVKQAAKQWTLWELSQLETDIATQWTKKELGELTKSVIKSSTEDAAKKSWVKTWLDLAKKWAIWLVKFGSWYQALDDLIVRPIKAITKWYKNAWLVWWVRDLLSYWLDTAWQFIGNPFSYRLPRIWTYDIAQKSIWEMSEAFSQSSDIWDFTEEHWYALANALAFKSDKALNDWYDQQWIPQDKRITLQEARAFADNMWWSPINNLLTWIRDTLSVMDPWQYNSWYYNAVEWETTWTIEEVSTTPRWRIRTSWWMSIDMETWEITNSNWDVVNIADLNDDERNDIVQAVLNVQSWDYSWVEFEDWMKADWSINITWLDQNSVAWSTIEWFVQNWMLTTWTIDSLMQWNKSKDAVYITTQLNEASKQFAHQIVNLYTSEELNKDPSKQAELLEYFWAYQRLFNATAEVINNSTDSVYNEKEGFNISNKWVYRFREAMSDAYNTLSARDQSLIDANIYEQAIDYNNNLETWFDKDWMQLATKIQRITDDFVVDWILRDDNADYWDKLWLSWLWDTAVNPNMVWSASMWWDVRSALTSNAAYLVDTAVVNFLNNNLVERFLWEWLFNLWNKILPAKAISSKFYNSLKWWWTEMTSEPLENLLDAVSMVDSADHNYDFMPWLMIGMLQGWLAWYASSRNNYSTVNEYFSNPENRKNILSQMWINIDAVDDPKKKAQLIAITNQAFDNLIPVMADAYARSNYWVESLAQWVALTLINRDLTEYATDILSQIKTDIDGRSEKNWWEWTESEILEVFWSMDDFNKYSNWQNFKFNQGYIDWFLQRNSEKFTNLKNRAESLIVTAQSIKWKNLQEVFDKMAPHINKYGTPIKPNLMKDKKDPEQFLYDNVLNPWDPAVSSYMLVSTLMWINKNNRTIADTIWIWKWSIAWDEKKWTFKKTIEITNEDWKTERISLKDYIIQQLNSAELWLTPEQRSFIFNMLFKTTVLWINTYFTNSWALTRMWKDFFNSVMPDVAWSSAIPNWQKFIQKDQTIKIANNTKSRKTALKERWTETHKNTWYISVWWQNKKQWEVQEFKDEDQIWNLVINWKPYTVWDLKKDWQKSFVKDWIKKTIIWDNWKIKLLTEPVESTVDENWKYISKEDREKARLESLSQEEFEKEYEQAENERKEAWRKYFELKEEIDKNPYHSESDGRDQRFDVLVRLERDGYKATNKKKLYDEVNERRKKAKNNNTQTQQQDSNIQQQKVENPDNIKTYWSKYVLDNMTWQSQIKDKYWHKVKSVYLSINDIEDVDKSQLTLPPEWVDFMDYEIKWWDSWIHFIVDKQWNVYTVLDSWHFWSEHFFETWIVKKWDEWIDNDIIDFLESVNDSSLINEWWILKVDYDYYVQHKKAILDWTEKPNWKKIHKNFVDFIESRHKSSDDDDDNTPPPASPAAPAVLQEEETVEWDVEVFYITEDKTEDDIMETEWDTRSSWISMKPEDKKELIEVSNKIKWELPILNRMKKVVPVKLAKDATEADSLTLQEKITLLWMELYDDNIDSAVLNSDEAKKEYQVITFKYKDWTVRKFYAVPQLNMHTTPESWKQPKWYETEYFNSFILVDFDSGERVVKTQNTIYRWPLEWLSYDNNNYLYYVVDKDWNIVKEPRVMNFTRSYEWKWSIATTIQLNRLPYPTRKEMYRKWLVFMPYPYSNIIGWRQVTYKISYTLPSDKEWVKWEVIDYDTRTISVPAPFITDPDVQYVWVWMLWDVDISWKSLSIDDLLDQNLVLPNWKLAQYEWDETDDELVELNETYLVKTDPTRVRELWKEIEQLNDSVQEKYEESLDEALSDTDDPNVSEEESINNYNKSQDENYYIKWKEALELIKQDANWLNISEYIDINLLSQTYLWDLSSDEQYKNLLLKSFLDWKKPEDLTAKEAFDLINRLSMISQQLVYLVDQWYEEYGNLMFKIQDMIYLIYTAKESEISDILLWNSLYDLEWADIDWVVNNFTNNWYCPIELWLNVDEDWKVHDVIIWTWMYTTPETLKNKYIFYHNHPNSSFFSDADISAAKWLWFKKIWLILPWWVILEFDVDNLDNNNIWWNWLWATVFHAVMESLKQWNFDKQKWWQFESVAIELKMLIEWWWDTMIDEQDALLDDFNSIAFDVYKQIDMDMKPEAFDTEWIWWWNPERYYFFRSNGLRSNDNSFFTWMPRNVLSNEPSSFTPAERDSAKRYLSNLYKVPFECKTTEDFNNLRKTAKANKWIYTLRETGTKKNHHFWNPWSYEDTYYEDWSVKTIKVESAEIAVLNYWKWLTWADFQSVQPTRRKWILKQIFDWSLKDKPIYYYTEDVTRWWNWWKYSNFWNQTTKYSYTEPYLKDPNSNYTAFMPYNHAMILWILISNPWYIRANRSLVEPKMNPNFLPKWEAIQYKRDQHKLAISNKLIWYRTNNLYSGLLFRYKNANPLNTNTRVYNDSDVVFVSIPNYRALNSTISDEVRDRDIDNCKKATLAEVKNAIRWWAQFVIDVNANKYEKEVIKLLLDSWYEQKLFWEYAFVFVKKWDNLNNVNEDKLIQPIRNGVLNDVVTDQENTALQNAEDVLDNMWQDNDTENAEVVDRFSPLLDEAKKSKIINDFKSLWLSLASLDREMLWRVLLAYVNWQWLEDVLKILASEIRSNALDNKLNDILIENWTLNKLWTYDWDTVDWAISRSWAIKFINKKIYWNTISNAEKRWLYRVLLRSEQLNKLNEYWDQFKKQFLLYYMEAQYFWKGKDVEWNDFIKKQKYKLWYVIDNYLAQPKEWLLYNAVYQAVSATDWIYSKKNEIIESLAQYITEEKFHLNYFQTSEWFKKKLRWIIENHLESNNITILETQSVNDDNRWSDYISEISELDDDVRLAMAVSLFEQWLISKWVFNYLASTNPIATVLNSDRDAWNWLFTSLIVKIIDDAFLNKWNVWLTAVQDKIKIFMDIYSFYALWWWTYDQLIEILDNKYGSSQDSSMNNLLNAIKEDCRRSKHWLYSEDIIEFILEKKEFKWDVDPYQHFIRNEWDNNPLKTPAIINALTKMYFEDQDSFFNIIQYAPYEIKQWIVQWMRSENDKDHWSNKAFGVVLWFLKNNQITSALNKLTINRINQIITQLWLSGEDIQETANNMISWWDDTFLITSTELTSQIYKTTWLNKLDLSKWTVLYTWDKWSEYKPDSWWKLDWTLIPIKNVSNIEALKADVNIIVPEWIQFPSRYKWDKVFNVVTVRCGIKNWMMVWNPKWSYKDWSDKIWTVISQLWDMWYNVWIIDWFKFTDEQLENIKNKKLKKWLYRRILNDIVIPSLPVWNLEISQRRFYRMITDESMANVNMDLLLSTIASKSIDDKINAAIIVINQVTKWKLELNTVWPIWTNKKINMEWAFKQFDEKILSLLDKNSETYERDRQLLTKFFITYYTVLTSMADSQSDESRWSWLNTAWFRYLTDNFQAAIWLLQDLREKNNFPVSKFALNINEDSDSSERISFMDTLSNVFDSNVSDEEIDAYIDNKQAIKDLKNKIKDQKKIVDNVRKEWESAKSKPNTKKRIEKRKELFNSIEIEEEKLDKLERELDELTWVLEDDISIDFLSDEDSGEYSDINDQFDEEIVETEFWNTNVIEQEEFKDKEVQVFATLFNNTIVDNISDIDSKEIKYNNDWENKFISNWVLDFINKELWSALETKVDFRKWSTLDEDIKNNKYAGSEITKWDMLELQSILSANKDNETQMNMILDIMFSISEHADNTDPVFIAFRKAREKIIRNPDKFTNVISELMDNDYITYDIIWTTLTKVKRFNKVKLNNVKNEIISYINKYTSDSVSSEELSEIKEKLKPYFIDKKWNQFENIEDDQAMWAWLIVQMFTDRDNVDIKKAVKFIAWMAWAWKTTMIVAALRYIQTSQWALTTDVDRIRNKDEENKQTMITYNFFQNDINKIKEKTANWWVCYIEVKMKDRSVVVWVTANDIIEHDKLKDDYEENPDAFIQEYWKWFWWVRWEQALLRMLELDSVREWWYKSDRWYKSNTRLVLKNIQIADWKTPDITIFWTWSSIKVKTDKSWKAEQEWPESLSQNNALKDIYILTKNNSTVQSINDVMWESDIVWLNVDTMDSKLIIKPTSEYALIWFWSTFEIKDNLENKLILIDEAQWSDDPTLNAIINWFWEKNNIILLWDSKQVSWWSIFAKWVDNWKNLLKLNSLFRWPIDVQYTNKLNSIIQDILIKHWIMAIFPNDSKDFVEYVNLEDIFWLKWTTMYAVRTNKRLAEVNRRYFEWATNNTNNVEIYNWNWTRDEVEKQQDKIFLFWDNTDDRVNTHYVPNETQAVIRWLPNAIWIDTKKNRWTDEESYFTDADFDQFKAQVDEAIQKAKNSWKIIVIPANGIWTWKAQLEKRAPKLFNYLQSELKKLSNQSTNKWVSNKPIPTMVINSLFFDNKWKETTNKWEINERNHEWINLSEYEKIKIDWQTVYYKQWKVKHWKNEWDVIEIFVPYLNNTSASSVDYIVSAFKKKTRKNINLRITTTAFAVTTNKESWKTVDNIVLDEWIFNPDYDFYNNSNVRHAYDSFTRWDKKVYYPKNSKRLLMMPMSQIKALIDKKNPNIDLQIREDVSETTEKSINYPVFYANDGLYVCRNMANKILGFVELVKDHLSQEEIEDLNKLISQLENAFEIEQSYNKWLLSLERQEWTKNYRDKYSEWYWKIISWLATQIWIYWDKLKDRTYQDKKTKEIKPLIEYNSLWEKEKKAYDSINWRVYWKKITIPNIKELTIFTSRNSANSKVTYANMIKANKELKDWYAGWFYNYKKTVDSKWNVVRSVVPADITWNVIVKPWILTNEEEKINNKLERDARRRINLFDAAFDDFKISGDPTAILALFDNMIEKFNLDNPADLNNKDKKIQTHFEKWTWIYELVNWSTWTWVWSTREVTENNLLWDMKDYIRDQLEKKNTDDWLRGDLLAFINILNDIYSWTTTWNLISYLMEEWSNPDLRHIDNYGRYKIDPSKIDHKKLEEIEAEFQKNKRINNNLDNLSHNVENNLRLEEIRNSIKLEEESQNFDVQSAMDEATKWLSCKI